MKDACLNIQTFSHHLSLLWQALEALAASKANIACKEKVSWILAATTVFSRQMMQGKSASASKSAQQGQELAAEGALPLLASYAQNASLQNGKISAGTPLE